MYNLVMSEKSSDFNNLFEETIKKGDNRVINYDLPYPKSEFLEYLVKEKRVLLHGSYNKEINMLEPRLANCASKEFGNLKAVYAVEDNILPIFYAIRDVAGVGFKGYISSGCHRYRDDTGQITRKEYHFELHPDDLAKQPWADGMVYILPRDTFVQGHNDNGDLIDEWASEDSVTPLAMLPVSPSDFPYMEDVTSYKVD